MTCSCKQKSTLKIKKLREGVQDVAYGSELASGFDVRAYACELYNIHTKETEPLPLEDLNGKKGWFIEPNTTVLFKTGLAMACGENEEIQVRARSGFSLKSPMRVSNGIGTLDADYRGEVGIIMDNNGEYGLWFVPYEERVAQLVVCPVIRPTIKYVEDLDETDRGEGGFGSTGMQ